MMAIRPSAERNVMVEVNYNQGREGTSLETVVQDVYLCASMEFLLTVADIFLKASQQGFSSAAPKNSSTKPTVTATAASKEPGTTCSHFTLHNIHHKCHVCMTSN